MMEPKQSKSQQYSMDVTLPAYMLNFQWEQKHTFIFYVIPPMTYLFYIVNTMAADVLAMQGARASATMILT